MIFEINLQGCAGSAAQSLVSWLSYVWLDGELEIGVVMGGNLWLVGQDLGKAVRDPPQQEIRAAVSQVPGGAGGQTEWELRAVGFSHTVRYPSPPRWLPHSLSVLNQWCIDQAGLNLLTRESVSIKSSLRAAGLR